MALFALYGGFQYGTTFYGAIVAGVPYQGEEDNAKQDTIYYALDQSTDLSQYNTDLVPTGTYAAYEGGSARGALTSSWTLEHRATYDPSARAGDIILIHGKGDGTDYTYRIQVGGTGALEFAINAVLVASITIPASSASRSISWAMRTNPDTTGAGDAKISEITVYDHTGGAWDIDHAQYLHAAPTSDITWTLTVHGRWDGAALQSQFDADVQHVRISSAYHSHVEVAEDWGTRRGVSTSTLTAHGEELPILQTSGLGDEGELVGQAQLGYLCRHQRHAVVRGFSPLVNEVYNTAPTWSNAYTPANMMRTLPQTSIRMPLTYLRWCAVPHNASHLYGRANVRSYVTAGASVPVSIVCVTMNYPPGAPLDWADGEAQIPTWSRFYSRVTIDVNHTAGGVGEWVDFGKIVLARNKTQKDGWWGSTFLALGYEIDPDATSGNDANSRIQILAWHVRPLSEDPVADGLTPDVIQLGEE